MALPITLWRSILREVSTYALLALAVLGFLMVGTILLTDHRMLAIAGNHVDLLVRVVLSILPAYLSNLIPASLLAGVMLALARMSADGEIVALRASGLNLFALVPPIALLGWIALIATIVIVFDLEPRSFEQLKVLRRELIYSNSLIEAGRVRSMGRGRSIYISENGDASCPLKGILISDFRDASPYYVSASCGKLSDAKSEEQLSLDLYRGEVHIAHEGDRYDRIGFTSSVVALDLDEFNVFRKRLSQYPFAELIGSMIGSHYTRSRISVEIQRRLATPLSGVLLALLAIPLGIRPARRGRSAGVLTGFLIMGAYWCAASSAQIAADREMVGAWALWLPNLIVAALAVRLLRRSARIEA